MEIQYDIISTIDILGILQGVILSIFLLVNKKIAGNKFYLALFILAYSLDIFTGLMSDLRIFPNIFDLSFLPINFNWLLFPLFFLYVREASVLESKSIYWPIIGAGIGITIECVLYFIELNTGMLNEWVEITSFSIELVFELFVGINIIRFINQHVKEVRNQYVVLDDRELIWARGYVLIAIIYITSGVISAFFLYQNWYVYFGYSLVNIILLYWVSLRGVFQQNIESLIENSEKVKGDQVKVEQSQEKVLLINSSNELEKMIKQVDDYLLESEIYSRVDLTIRDISIALDIHPKRLSSGINKCKGINFNTYVNNFRVAKATKLLTDEKHTNLSVEGIGAEVGFQSKSTFYAAFRKATRTTPSKYKSEKLN